jgi:hypothetical protein
MYTIRLSVLAVAVSLAAMAGPVLAQTWSTYQAPGSPFTDLTGPHGWHGDAYQAPGSPFTDTTIYGPHGQVQRCSTYQAPGSPFADTTCH